MNSKKSLGFLGLGVLLVLTLLSFASAAGTITFSNVPTLSQTGTSATITVTDTVAESVTPTITPITDTNGKIITFTLASPLNLIVGANSVSINYNVPSNFVFETGKTYSTTLTINGIPQVISFVATNEPTGVSTCKVTKAANPNTSLDNMGVSIDSNSIITGFGSDTTWYPLDSVEVKVTVDNNGNNDMRKLVVNWALYDTAKQKVILHNKLSSFSLNSDSSKSVKIDFTLDDPTIFKNNNYIFYTWVTGEDKDTSDTTCNSDSEAIDVPIDNNFVVLSSLQTEGTVSCGTTTQITGKIWNIGDSDESGVYVMVSNAELGLSQKINVGDINSLDSKDLLFNVNMPDNAEQGKTYLLTFVVYDGDGNIFENSDNDQAKSYLNLQLTGSCSTVPPVSITANLQSAAVSGNELDVTVTLKNTASTTQTFSLDLSGYQSWASLISLEKNSLTLSAGQSQDVLVKLKPNTDATGDQSFNVVVTQGTKILSQPVSVTVEKPGFNLTGAFSGMGGNAYIWGIGILNVILVLVIIIVAVRVVRKK